MEVPPECKVYVGRELQADVTVDDLRKLFEKYGPIKAVWVARSPPGFGYVSFKDSRDAKDACRALDGTEYRGRKLCVEIARGPRPNRPGRMPDYERNFHRRDYRSRSPRDYRSFSLDRRNRTTRPDSRREEQRRSNGYRDRPYRKNEEDIRVRSDGSDDYNSRQPRRYSTDRSRSAETKNS